MLENLVVKVPDILFLRSYAYQMLRDSYGLSENFREYLCSTKYGFNESIYHIDYWPIFNSICDEDFESLLRHYFCELPEYFFYFKSKEYNPGENYKDYEYEKIPRLFTNVIDVIFTPRKEVKYVIMELYGVQISSLYDKDGNQMVDFCNDLDFGKFNNIILRTTSRCSWEHYRIKEGSLKLVDIYNPFDYPQSFPYRDRVKVEVFHPDKNNAPILRLEEKGNNTTNKKFSESIFPEGDLDDFDKIFGSMDSESPLSNGEVKN